MKHLFILLFMSFFLGAVSYAEETDTQCKQMMESNDRSNPKDNSQSVKSKPRTRSGSATAQ